MRKRKSQRTAIVCPVPFSAEQYPAVLAGLDASRIEQVTQEAEDVYRQRQLSAEKVTVCAYVQWRNNERLRSAEILENFKRVCIDAAMQGMTSIAVAPLTSVDCISPLPETFLGTADALKYLKPESGCAIVAAKLSSAGFSVEIVPVPNQTKWQLIASWA